MLRALREAKAEPIFVSSTSPYHSRSDNRHITDTTNRNC